MDVAALIPTINGSETLQGTANLWIKISNLPLPPLHRILPAQHAYWNQTKSGSDTTTKLMDKCIAIVPHTTPESVAYNRMMSLDFVTGSSTNCMVQNWTFCIHPSSIIAMLHPSTKPPSLSRWSKSSKPYTRHTNSSSSGKSTPITREDKQCTTWKNQQR